jgi:xanthine/uracil permease
VGESSTTLTDGPAGEKGFFGVCPELLPFGVGCFSVAFAHVAAFAALVNTKRCEFSEIGTLFGFTASSVSSFFAFFALLTVCVICFDFTLNTFAGGFRTSSSSKSKFLSETNLHPGVVGAGTSLQFGAALSSCSSFFAASLCL